MLPKQIQRSSAGLIMLGGALLVGWNVSRVDGEDLDCAQRQDGNTGCNDCMEYVNVDYSCPLGAYPQNEFCFDVDIDNKGCRQTFVGCNSAASSARKWPEGCFEGNWTSTTKSCNTVGIYYQEATNLIISGLDCDDNPYN